MALVTVAFFEIDGQHLPSVRTLDIDLEDPTADTVRTMSVNPWPIGHKRSYADVGFTIEAVVTSPQDFDWHAAIDERSSHQAVYEEAVDRDTAGDRYLMVTLQLYSLSKSHNSDGESVYRIAGKALRHIAE